MRWIGCSVAVLSLTLEFALSAAPRVTISRERSALLMDSGRPNSRRNPGKQRSQTLMPSVLASKNTRPRWRTGVMFVKMRDADRYGRGAGTFSVRDYRRRRISSSASAP